MSVFSDPKLAKMLYEADVRANKDVAYNKKFNAYIQRFQGQTAIMIRDKLRKEIKDAGGYELEK